MKKIVISSLLTSLFMSNAIAGENGGFIGFNLGTGFGVNVSPSTGGVGIDVGGTTLATLAVLGLKGGYQAYFNEASGVRFYLSAMGGLNASTNQGSTGLTLFVLGDVDADILIDFVPGDTSFGMYMGIFTGALIDMPLAPSGNSSTGIAAGLNLGFRTAVENHHEFEMGIKIAGAFYRAKAGTNNIGLLTFIGAGYSYKF